jgi:hypothetical protein
MAATGYVSFAYCSELIAVFSNTLSKRQIEEMATVDEFEVVKEVQVS